MKIKICGMTNDIDARFAVENGADFIGFILYPKSPRYVSPDIVRRIIHKLPQQAVTVGVFVNESNETMVETARYCGLKYLQLHGDETWAQIGEITDYPVIKALRLQGKADIRNFAPIKDRLILIDTPSPDYGGTGKIANWKLARTVALSCQILLAGGLNPENVVSAMSAVKPYGVDVVTGVEKEKGIKDSGRVKAFLDSVRTFATNNLLVESARR